MSYLRWLCAMHFAKLTRHGNALVETVNAFRLHRQQKTLACEAAAKARAELWTRLTENLRRLRAGEPSYLRKSMQSRRLDHVQQTNFNGHETGADTVRNSGSLRSAANEITKHTFRGEQGYAASSEASAVSTVLGHNCRQAGESLGKLWQQEKPSVARGELSPTAAKKPDFASPKKSLAVFAFSKSCPWSDGKSHIKTDQKTTAESNKPTDESAMLVRSTTACPSKRKVPKFLPAVQKCNTPRQPPQDQKAVFLPERPNILVLPEMNNSNDFRAILQKHAASIYDNLQQTNGPRCEQELKLLPAPANTLKSTADCQISTDPEDCMLPPQSDSPMAILVTNVLDKYKIISLPAGRAIPGRPRRHVQIETKKRGPVRAGNQPDWKRRKF